MGMIATQAAKKIHVCASGRKCSSRAAIGIKMSSQLIVTIDSCANGSIALHQRRLFL